MASSSEEIAMKQPLRPRRRGLRAGFTLIEILVVLLIIGLLVTLVGQNVFQALFKGQRGAAEIQIRNFAAILDRYRMDNFKYPDTLEELTEPDENGEPYVKTIPLDPWNNPYEYDLQPDGNYVIVSYGADGEAGGEGGNADLRSDEL